jgi:hypothetical protein
LPALEMATAAGRHFCSWRSPAGRDRCVILRAAASGGSEERAEPQPFESTSRAAGLSAPLPGRHGRHGRYAAVFGCAPDRGGALVPPARALAARRGRGAGHLPDRRVEAAESRRCPGPSVS